MQDIIRGAILDGTLEPGEHLHDEDLTSWLGVSRTPIRESLTALQREGLIEMAPNRFTRVAQPVVGNLIDALQAAGIIIGGIVRVTLPTLTSPQRRDIVARLDEALELLRRDGTSAILPNLDSMYETWLSTCPNPALVAVGSHALRGLAYKFRVDSVDDMVPASPMLDQLTAFRDAVAATDPELAELAIEAAHLVDATPSPLLRDEPKTLRSRAKTPRSSIGGA